MDPAQLDPNGDGGGRVVGSNSRRVDDTRVRPTPPQSGLRILRSQSTCSSQTVEAVEIVDVLSECGPGFEIGWKAGVSLHRQPATCLIDNRCD